MDHIVYGNDLYLTYASIGAEDYETDSRISHISHDLKTPATVAKGYIEAILNLELSAELSERYLRKIDERIETITGLVKNLNDLSLLETKQIVPNCIVMRADELFGRLLHKWSEPLALDGHLFKYEILAPVTALVHADEQLLSSVVDNLMSNAIKYSAQGTCITASLDANWNSITLRLKDEGIGIPVETLPYIFDSFYRVDASRNSDIPGSGLGLAIAREIMIMHNGAIGAERNAERGCTFWIELQRADLA